MAKKSVTARKTDEIFGELAEGIEQRRQDGHSQPDDPVYPEALPDFGALLTSEQVEAFEKKAQEFTPTRRLIFALMGRSRAQMIGVDGSPEEVSDALLGMLEVVDSYQEHLVALKEVADIAWARIFAAAQSLADMELARDAADEVQA